MKFILLAQLLDIRRRKDRSRQRGEESADEKLILSRRSKIFECKIS